MFFISMTLGLFLALLTSFYVSDVDGDVVGKGWDGHCGTRLVPGFCLYFEMEMYVLWYCLPLEVCK